MARRIFGVRADDLLSTIGDGSLALPGMHFVLDPDSGVRRIGANNWALVAGGADVLVIDANGDLTVAAGVFFIGDGAVGAPGIAFKDDLDNGLYRIGANNWALSVAGAKALELDPIGAILKPLQPSFHANRSGSSGGANFTGDGTAVDITFDNEVYDQNADYDGTATFTAPVTGKYHFDFGMHLTGIAAGHDDCAISFTATGRTVIVIECHPGNMATATGVLILSSSIDIEMTAADTIKVTVDIAGATKVIDLGNSVHTFFSGHLIA